MQSLMQVCRGVYFPARLPPAPLAKCCLIKGEASAVRDILRELFHLQICFFLYPHINQHLV